MQLTFVQKPYGPVVCWWLRHHRAAGYVAAAAAGAAGVELAVGLYSGAVLLLLAASYIGTCAAVFERIAQRNADTFFRSTFVERKDVERLIAQHLAALAVRNQALATIAAQRREGATPEEEV